MNISENKLSIYLTDKTNTAENLKKCYSRPGSNRGPSACKADVITTTLQELLLMKSCDREIFFFKFEFFFQLIRS